MKIFLAEYKLDFDLFLKLNKYNEFLTPEQFLRHMLELVEMLDLLVNLEIQLHLK